MSSLAEAIKIEVDYNEEDTTCSNCTHRKHGINALNESFDVCQRHSYLTTFSIKPNATCKLFENKES